LKVLFVNDGSITNPILQAQGLPHLAALAELGHKIYVLSFESKGIGDEKRKSIMHQYEGRISFLPVWVISPAIIRVLSQILIGGHFITFFYVKKYSIEIIHARGYVSAIVSLFTRAMLNVRLIFDMRGLMIDEMISKGRWKPNSVITVVMRFFERLCILHADYLIVVSGAFRKYIESLKYVSRSKKPLDIGVVPNSVEVSRFMVPEEVQKKLKKQFHLEDRFVVLYAGSLDTWQLPSYMMEFFLRFKMLCPQAFFLVLTYSDLTEKIRSEINYDKLRNDDVLFLSISPEMMPVYLSLGNIGIIFRKQELLNQVSSPLKVGEYLAAGIPILLTRGIGDTENVLSNHDIGMFVEEFSTRAFDDASKRIIHFYEKKNHEVFSRCRMIASEVFSFEKAVQQYDNIYRKIA
jgi:glycosyltransferase involved in cell wall biosynthesis